MEKTGKQSELLKKKISEYKEKLTAAIKDCNQVYITTHLNEDYDAIASIGAMALICKRLQKPNRDPRDDYAQPILKSDVLSIEDLSVGMKLQGTVRNVVDFGAFIDIGLHNDGLVHISKISKDYIKHPSDLLSVGDIVDCYVIAIDKDKEKVSLSLIKE
jgi:protein Tex